jgi:hypothetical protein
MPELDAHAIDRIVCIADFVTRARSGVDRDRFTREIEYVPEAECPTRFAKVLRNLAIGVAIAHDEDRISKHGLVFRLLLQGDRVVASRHTPRAA